MSGRKHKARRMWVAPELYSLPGKAANVFSAAKIYADDLSVAVIPLNDVEALIEKAAAEYIESSARWISVAGRMRDALTAIGVIPKARKASKN